MVNTAINNAGGGAYTTKEISHRYGLTSFPSAAVDKNATLVAFVKNFGIIFMTGIVSSTTKMEGAGFLSSSSGEVKPYPIYMIEYSDSYWDIYYVSYASGSDVGGQTIQYYALIY